MSTSPTKEEIADRAAEVAALPHVRAWTRRFRKLAAEMPPEIWVYVASGTPSIVALDAHGEKYMGYGKGGDGAQREACMTLVDGGRWDGGDW